MTEVPEATQAEILRLFAGGLGSRLISSQISVPERVVLRVLVVLCNADRETARRKLGMFRNPGRLSVRRSERGRWMVRRAGRHIRTFHSHAPALSLACHIADSDRRAARALRSAR